MGRFLFFAYREWAINIFKDVSNEDDEFILISNNLLCTKKFIDTIKPDVIFLYGWSWIVPKEIVENYTCLCLHPSKLPKYRGGTPIQNQIMNEEYQSAVTIFKMGVGLDDGDIFYQTDIKLTGYLDEIFKRIEGYGSWGTKCFIEAFKKDIIRWTKQDENAATTYKRIRPSNSEIKPEDFLNNSSRYFYNKVRGLQPPYPEAFIKCKSGKLILEKVRYERDI